MDCFTNSSLVAEKETIYPPKSICPYMLILITSCLFVTPSPIWDKGNGPETRPGIKSQMEDVVPNLPALAGTLAIHGG